MINDNVRLYVILYVDDGIICSDNLVKMNDLFCKLSLVFSVKSSEAEFFVGMQIKRDRILKTLKLFQSAYTHKILNRFNFDNCASLSIPADPNTKFCKTDEKSNQTYNCPYREAIGSLMFLMVSTRPDIAYTMSVLSHFSEQPNENHWNGVKRVFWYLKGTINYEILFGENFIWNFIW